MATGTDDATKKSWLQLELEDDFDEELEQEIDDTRIPAELRDLHGVQRRSPIDRGTYSRELLRLLGKLVKLQDWVVHKGLNVVVL